MAKRYAKRTAVSVSKSRGEIDALLRKWGANQLQWSDDHDEGLVMLRFLWKHREQSFVARFVIRVPPDQDLREEAKHATTGVFSQTKYDKLAKRRGMVEHRELALLLKAIFVAVDAGIISAEQVFLPFIEGSDGQTLSETIIPRLAEFHKHGSVKCLLETNPRS